MSPYKVGVTQIALAAVPVYLAVAPLSLGQTAGAQPAVKAQPSEPFDAVADTRRRAEAGDARAQRELGELYEWGHGLVTPNANEALKWSRRAVAQGNAEAHLCLGIALLLGRGGELDIADVLDLPIKARHGQRVRREDYHGPAGALRLIEHFEALIPNFSPEEQE